MATPISAMDSNGYLWLYNNPIDGTNDKETFDVTGYLFTMGIIDTGNVNVHMNGGWIDGNDSAGTIAVQSSSNGFQLWGNGIISNFESGVVSLGSAATVAGDYEGALKVNANNLGVGLSGNSSAYNVDVKVGYPSNGGNAFGFVGWNGGNSFAHDNVINQGSTGESVGYSFGYGGSMYDCTATGSPYVSGWSFGVWAGGGGPVSIASTTIGGYDVGIGNVSPVELQDTFVSGLVDSIINQQSFNFIDNGGNTLNEGTPDTSAIIYGTTGTDHLLGDGGDQVLVGAGGADVLFGGHGADTFVFSPAVMSIAPDYSKAEGDTIYLAYNYPTAVVSFDAASHTLVVDGMDYAYLPYANSLSDVSYHF